MLVALLIALPIGTAAGYFGGVTDAAVSRFTETVMAFPLLLFLIFASARISSSLQFASYGWVVPKGVVTEALLIGLFTSFYPTRLIRAHLQTLRSTEFVEASHMIGASNRTASCGGTCSRTSSRSCSCGERSRSARTSCSRSA